MLLNVRPLSRRRSRSDRDSVPMGERVEKVTATGRPVAARAVAVSAGGGIRTVPALPAARARADGVSGHVTAAGRPTPAAVAAAVALHHTVTPAVVVARAAGTSVELDDDLAVEAFAALAAAGLL